MGTVIPENRVTFGFDQLLQCVGGVVEQAGDGQPVVGVSTDSRRIRPGNAFVALEGERFDGHDHAAAAVRAGASTLIVSRSVHVDPGVAVIRVENPLNALGLLAREHRRQWASEEKGKIVAVTGSAGKTTTCRAIAAVLEALSPGANHATAGNLNNAIGVPMVLLALEKKHRQAVVEIGTSSPGEIEYAASLVEPDVGVLTLVACAHTEGLGSIEAVAQEKGALFAALPPGGVCVANADDELVQSQLRRSKATRVVTFGRAKQADVRVIEAFGRGWSGQLLRMEVRVGNRLRLLEASVPLLGAAGTYASSAALAVALAVWGDAVNLDRAVEGLRLLHGESGRLRPRSLERGAVLIDDAYNANPASMHDSIDVAATLAEQEGRALTLVLGEMRELGALSEGEHREVGAQVARLRPGFVVTVGGDSRYIDEVASAAGVSSVFVPDAESAKALLLAGMGDRDVILVKGSRGVALERVVAAIEAWGEGREE